MFNFIVNWYKLYPSTKVFLEHKAVHFGLGFMVALLVGLTQHRLIGLGFVVVLAIGKEVADRLQESNPDYRAPLSANILDIIVTVLGGLAGVGVSML